MATMCNDEYRASALRAFVWIPTQTTDVGQSLSTWSVVGVHVFAGKESYMHGRRIDIVVEDHDGWLGSCTWSLGHSTCYQ
jgi:hypothetical protein